MPVIKKQSPTIQKKSSQMSSLVDRIRPVSEGLTKDRMLIYGVSGTGKTRLACTYPKPMLLIGVEDGRRSVSNSKDVEFIKLNEVDDVRLLLELIRESEKYETVCLDTATSFQALTLKEVLGLEELPAQKAWGMASQQQYGQSSLQTKECLRHLLRLAEDNICHVVITAQERSFGNRDGGEDIDDEIMVGRIMASLTNSVVGWLNPECDFICQTFKRQKVVKRTVTIGSGPKAKTKTMEQKTSEVEYCLRSGPHPTYVTKFRQPEGIILPDVIVNPTYPKLVEILG